MGNQRLLFGEVQSPLCKKGSDKGFYLLEQLPAVLMMPPCGVPSVVGVSILLNATPALSHFLRIALSTGSSAIRYIACIALSCMVGIPNGRCLPLLFAINTLLRGLGLYPLRLRDFTALNFEAGVIHFTWSIPAVRFPLLDVTLLTANALASKEVTKRCCRAFTLPYLLSF